MTPSTNIKLWKNIHGLRRKGILGLNRRNVDYLLPRNPRPSYQQVDNKLATKEICQSHGIKVPETYVIIKKRGEVTTVPQRIRNRPRFAVKPAGGSSGRGILVIDGGNSGENKPLPKNSISPGELKYHILKILSGLYSLDGLPDQAIIEQCISVHPGFKGFSPAGLPDIRIIVYRGVPTMAMARLPTVASEGRANLHQGAIGLGIHLDSGKTFGGVQENRSVHIHPDTKHPLPDIHIPCWPDILKGAIKLGDALNLGLIGVDYAIDAQSGPVVLEANARPGLSIQIANRSGLAPRFAFVDNQQPESLNKKQKLELAFKLEETL